MADVLTPERRAFIAEHGDRPFETCTCIMCRDIAEQIRAAAAQARAEGRAEGLRDALRVDGRCYDDCVYAQRLRSLAGQPSGDAKGK